MSTNGSSSAAQPSSLLTPADVTTAVTIVLMASVFIARMTVKAFSRKDFQLEDYALILAMIGILAFMSIYLSGRNFGVGLHIEVVPEEDYSKFLYTTNVAEIIYGPVIFVAKWSVLLQQRRLFTTANKGGVYWAINAVIYTNAVYYFAATLAFIFQCNPREAIWNLDVDGKCMDYLAATFSSGVMNLVSDVVILALPLWVIWHLQIPIKKKMPVYAIFSTGLLACISAALSVAYRSKLLNSADFTYIITQIGMLIMAEFCAIIMVACMPSIPQFVRLVCDETKSVSSSLRLWSTNSSQRPFTRSQKSDALTASTSHDLNRIESRQYARVEEPPRAYLADMRGHGTLNGWGDARKKHRDVWDSNW